MKLIDVVKAYIAADEMSTQMWPYDMALAIVRVRQQTRTEAEFFIGEERKLIEQYAMLDENGSIRMTPNGTFLFKDPAQAPDYERERAALGNTDVDGLPPKDVFRVKAPAVFKPSYIEALEGFMEFVAGETSPAA
jgi:hypothetical protein